MVKLVLEISKKILPTASTFTRQLAPGLDGTVMFSVPSFDVDDANTIGNVLPPSVDNNMFTDAQLTGAAVVLFTLHVTVADEPAFQVTAVFGAVTAKGPEVLETVTTASVNCVWPTSEPATYGWLSLTVNRKFKVLETELNASILVPASPPGNTGVTFKPARIVDNFGNNLVPDTTGENDKIGRAHV